MGAPIVILTFVVRQLPYRPVTWIASEGAEQE